MSRRGFVRALAIGAMVAGSMTGVSASTPLVQIRFSPDITATFDPTVLDDEDVAADNLAGTVTLQNIGTIPSEADVDGYAVRPNGDQLLSFDTTVVLPGGLTAGPADVVRYDGSTYVTVFNAAARGIPSGVNIDAVAVHETSLLLSFDVAVDLGTVHAEPEDLVLFDGDGFSLYFDGSAAGVPAGLDLDAAYQIDCNDHLLLSFDGGGSLGGIDFLGSDVLELNGSGTWEMAYNGVAQHPAWRSADLDALSATPNLGPGPPAVFGQTITSNADKVTVRWPSPVRFKAVRGSFSSSTSIGWYSVDFTATGTGSSFVDATSPAPGTGYWYLVKTWICTQQSWQSTLGLEPGRDQTIP